MFKIITAKDGRKVMLRSIVTSDLKRAEEYTDYINSFIAEDDYILLRKKVTVDEEKEFVKKSILGARKNSYTIIAECDGRIIGTASVEKKTGRMDHVAHMGIIIRKGYREIGIGSHMMEALIGLARGMKCKIVRLEVFPANKRAANMYKKFGFRKVASIPKQIQRRGRLVDEVIMLKEL